MRRAAVAAGNMLVVAADVVQAPNDKQQIEPTLIPSCGGLCLRRCGETETPSSRTQAISAVRNVEACEKAGVEPVIAMGRHAAPVRLLAERFAKTPEAPVNPDTWSRAMAHRLKTPEGRDLYAPRKQDAWSRCSASSNPCSDSASAFSMRGLEKARGEWSLVTMAWNIASECSPSTRPEAEPVRHMRLRPSR